MSDTFHLERMLPAEIRRTVARAPVVYLPLGAIEWHGEHLPVGLDGLTARGFCDRAARRTGGIVFPPLYYGMTASIGHHPWTILAEDATAWLHPLRVTLRRLADFGVRLAVIFTGHFALAQLEALRQLANDHAATGSSVSLRALAINGMPAAPLPSDHGGRFETSLLSVLHPDLVRMDRLPSAVELPQPDATGDHRRDPSHPLFGILGPDPRLLNAAQASDLARRIESWLVEETRTALAAVHPVSGLAERGGSTGGQEKSRPA